MMLGPTFVPGFTPVVGNYVPVPVGIANIANIQFLASGYWIYVKIGNMVIVGGQVSITTVAAGQFQVNFNLPFPSNVLSSDVDGNATSPAGGIIGMGSFVGIGANTTQLVGWSTNAAANGYRVLFMYVIK